MSVEIINYLKRILKGISTVQGVLFNHHTRHEQGGGDEVSIAGVPGGIIVMWSGTLATIPDGWTLCDGGNGTPDLRDKFIYGCSAAENPGATGGAATHQHSYSQVPSHTHGVGTLGADSAGAHTHGAGSLEADSGGAHTHGTGTLAIGGVGNHTHGTGTLAIGGVDDHTHGYSDSYLRTGYPLDILSNAAGSDDRIQDQWRATGGAGGHGHTISGSTASGGSHSHTISGDTASGGSHTHTISGSTASGGSHTHTISGSTASTGIASPVTDAASSLPSYYKLAFIMKI